MITTFVIMLIKIIVEIPMSLKVSPDKAKIISILKKSPSQFHNEIAMEMMEGCIVKKTSDHDSSGFVYVWGSIVAVIVFLAFILVLSFLLQKPISMHDVFDKQKTIIAPEGDILSKELINEGRK